MPHLRSKFLLFFSVLFLISCGEKPLVQPDLISAGLSTAVDQKPQDLLVVDWSSRESTELPTTGLTAVPASSKTILLGFSQLLKGDSVTADSIKIFNGNTLLTGFIVTYRPDGYYIPPADTPVSEFPPPAVVIGFTESLVAGSTIAIHVLAGKIANVDGTAMAQLKNKNGAVISTPDGSPVAGTAVFQVSN